MIAALYVLMLFLVTTASAEQQSFKVPVQGSITLHIQNNAVQAIHLPDRSTIPLQAYQAVHTNAAKMYNWCIKNPVKTLIGTAMISYGAVWGVIAYLHAVDNAPTNWSNWKHHVPVEILQEVPINDFMNELSLDVMQCYDKFDAWSAWSALLKDVDSNVRFYQKTLYLFYTVRALHISFLWGNVVALIENIEKRTQRLALIKNRVTSFLSSHLPSFAQHKQP